MERHMQIHFERTEFCPYCGSDEIEGRSVEVENQWAVQRVDCLACGRFWHDRYRSAEVIDDQGHRHPRPSATSPPPMPPGPDRDLRQRDLVPAEALSRTHATVIGVGAIGRQVALQLAAMGVPRLELIDPQIVETVNLAAQGYLEEDLGQPKAEATARLALRLNSRIEIDPLIQRFRRSQDVGNAVFACVDSIETRRLIFQAVKDRVPFLCDGRMSAEVVRVLSADDEVGLQHYPTTLFAAEEAHAGACTARSTIFTANVAAGMMLEQFTRHLRRLPVDPDISLNLLTSELTIGDHGSD